MKLKVLQENLSTALNTTSRFASSKMQLPVLANVLLSASKNKLLISATNLEVSVSLSVGAKVEKKGDLTVPARTITDLVSNLTTGQVNLESKNESLKISTEGFNSTVSGMNSSDFPDIPKNIKKPDLKIPSDVFQDALGQVLYAVSTDETRPVLTGVLMIIEKGNLILVSTDGFRLSQKKISLKKKKAKELDLIVPKSALSELSRLSGDEDSMEFSFNKKDNQVVFGVSGAILASRIIEGEFPDFERIIPEKTEMTISLDKEEFLRAVKLASVFARDAANVVKLKVEEDSVEVSAESKQTGSQETKVDAKVETDSKLDEEFVIAFNYRFLEDFLNSVEGEDVEIGLSDTKAPGVFKDPKDKDFLHIIMPVRLQD